MKKTTENHHVGRNRKMQSKIKIQILDKFEKYENRHEPIFHQNFNKKYFDSPKSSFQTLVKHLTTRKSVVSNMTSPDGLPKPKNMVAFSVNSHAARGLLSSPMDRCRSQLLRIFFPSGFRFASLQST